MHVTPVRRRQVLVAALTGIAIASTGAAGPAFAAEATGSITGQVRDTRGAVVANAYIAVHLDPNSGAVQERQADERGRFSITDLKPGSYKISIGQSGWSEWAPGRITDAAQAPAFPVRANRATVVNSTVTAAGILAGKLLNPDGTPNANAAVNITNVDTSSGSAGLTAADGTFRIKVQPNATFTVSYSVGSLSQYVPHTFDPAQATRFFVPSGRTVQVSDQAVALSGIAGRLTDAAGAPVSGAYVTFTNVDTAGPSQTDTAADGTFDFSNLLEPGRYKVEFTVGGRSQYSYQKSDWESADIITIVSGRTATVNEQLLWVPTAR
ncbi:hypothetical protein Aph02nite_22940 [Actinoplanes philippinensis]|uniref:Carboxypeptidase regulatory-like domain-containing protein n=1 Tax=Actinoplanes philippinensis TaxID=35752 RepID=A0A1I2MCQ1_9ACTN|nr:carboxypeptidase-like regulatory domain-containing protein [Actinoplanes philippinensis]GIE76344.1 hypothetical protein Aph02nite_22940 [Actinoplanes philippinensis]SFF89264.1 Carboxypeptidase regulatory-like domain-containing protein [Actinoplanes philippinensis]